MKLVTSRYWLKDLLFVFKQVFAAHLTVQQEDVHHSENNVHRGVVDKCLFASSTPSWCTLGLKQKRSKRNLSSNSGTPTTAGHSTSSFFRIVIFLAEHRIVSGYAVHLCPGTQNWFLEKERLPRLGLWHFGGKFAPQMALMAAGRFSQDVETSYTPSRRKGEMLTDTFGVRQELWASLLLWIVRPWTSIRTDIKNAKRAAEQKRQMPLPE